MAVNTGFIGSHKSQHVVNQMNVRLMLIDVLQGVMTIKHSLVTAGGAS